MTWTELIGGISVFGIIGLVFSTGIVTIVYWFTDEDEDKQPADDAQIRSDQ